MAGVAGVAVGVGRSRAGVAVGGGVTAVAVTLAGVTSPSVKGSGSGSKPPACHHTSSPTATSSSRAVAAWLSEKRIWLNIIDLHIRRYRLACNWAARVVGNGRSVGADCRKAVMRACSACHCWRHEEQFARWWRTAVALAGGNAPSA